MKNYYPCTLIFIGISGCGKGTQVSKMIEFLEDNFPENPVRFYESGERLRSFAKGTSTFSNSVRRLLEAGKLVPDTIVNGIMEDFLSSLKNEEYCILDGYPRTLEQAINLDKALHSHRRQDPVIVVHIKLSDATAIDRLMERARIHGRPDDASPDSISERLEWFERKVEPAIKFFKESKGYKFIEIDGEESVEKVHSLIVESVAEYLVATV